MNELEDACALFNNAVRHWNYYISLRDCPEQGFVTIQSTIVDEGRHSMFVKVNTEGMRRAKPVLGDVANNLRHALDHIAAAAKRSNSSKTVLSKPKSKLFYPVNANEADFRKALKTVREHVGDEYADLMAEGRQAWARPLERLDVIYDLSNDSKHVRLGVSGFDSDGLIITQAGGEVPIDIPLGHFDHNNTFEFWCDRQVLWAEKVTLASRYWIKSERMEERANLEEVFTDGFDFVRSVIGLFQARMVAL